MIFFTFALIIQTAFAYETSCFSRHLDEAIQLNEDRKGLYSKLTAGESERLSDVLIDQQKWTKYYAYYYDWRAENYQENGIPVLCDEFVSMDLTPPFIPYLEPRTKIESLPELPLSDWQSALNDADGFEKLVEVSLQMVQSFNDLPDYYCLTRHFLKSIIRSAHLAPGHIEKSSEANLPNPQELLLDFIKLHIDTLTDAYELDRTAFPIQAKGIPILCRDVPEMSITD